MSMAQMPSTAAIPKQKDGCAVCKRQKKTFTFQACGHEHCAYCTLELYVSGHDNCPDCGEKINSVVWQKFIIVWYV